MIQNFRGKNTKDTETAPETILANPITAFNITNNTLKAEVNNVTNQQLINENIDSYIMEKKKKL